MSVSPGRARVDRRTVTLWTAVGLSTLIVASCASLLGLDAPEIALANLRLERVTLTETAFRVDVRVTNTNPEPLVVDGATFTLVLDGARVGTGVSNELVEISRLDSAVLHAEMFVNHLDMVRRVRAIVEHREFSYALKGRLYVRLGTSTHAIRVAQKGSLDLEETFDLQPFKELDRLEEPGPERGHEPAGGTVE